MPVSNVEAQPSAPLSDRLPSVGRGLAYLATAAAFVWFIWLTPTNDRQGNVIDGLEILWDGLWRVPGIVFSGDGYASWFEFVGDNLTDGEGGGILAVTMEHVQLVLTSMLYAVIISVVLGVAAHRVAALKGFLLGVFSIGLTIPSLALFAIFISIDGIGIGDRGPILALILYSVLPILRNTITGLDEVDRAVLESAKGMGMSATQRLFRIELPLAWPVILTGIRVATLLNVGIAAIAVLVGGSGLGFFINVGLQNLEAVNGVERLWTGVVFTVLVAIVLDLLFGLIRLLTTPGGLRK